MRYSNFGFMIKFSFSPEILLKHFTEYFHTSLNYFPQKYLKLFLNDGDLIPNHVAYLCPLCVSNFLAVLQKDEKIIASSDFTLDHYPQKSIGGNTTILVCKSCNNEAGHNYEFALKQHLDLSSFSQKGLSHKIDVKSSIPNVGTFNSQLGKNVQGQWEISLKPKENIKIQPLDNWIEHTKTNTGWEFQMTVSKPKQELINKSILKSAYLYCFSHWGYEFAFSKTGDLFRKILSNKENYPMVVMPLKIDKDTVTTFEKIPTGVCYISRPEHLKSLIVNIQFKDKNTGFENIHPVFIPNPTETGTQDLKKIQKLMDDQITDSITIAPLPNILKQTPIAYSQTWYNVQHIY